jgi:hypothetical protein
MNEHEDLGPVLGRALESWRTSTAPPSVVSAVLERLARRPPPPTWRERLWPILPAVAAGVTVLLLLSTVPAAEAEVSTALQAAPEGVGADPAAALRATMRPWLIAHIVAVVAAYLVFVLVWAVTQGQVVLGLFGVRRWRNLVAHLTPAALAFGVGSWLLAMILGAIWARSVMGRAWDWDPKEVGALGTLATSLVWLALAWWLRSGSFPWPATAAPLCWLLLDFWWGALAQVHTSEPWLSATTRCIVYGALLNVVLLASAWWVERRQRLAQARGEMAA